MPAVQATLAQAAELRPRSGPHVSTLAGARVLVLGAGGAARAVVHAAQNLGAEVTVAGRSAGPAAALAGELGCCQVAWEKLQEQVYDVLVNTTPIGSAALNPGETPMPPQWLRTGTIVLDAVYRPIKTALLGAAHARGCTAVP